MSIDQMTVQERAQTLEALRATYADFQVQKLALNMARGKPSTEQLDRVSRYDQRGVSNDCFYDAEGTDVRNYGGLSGLPQMRAIFANMLDVKPDQVLALGNSSLSLMAQVLSFALIYGRSDSQQPWLFNKRRKFLCPSPGYDRHFALTAHQGFELIPVPMTADGPDMDRVEALCAQDEDIKGIWCVPKYSNPDGYVYSQEVCERLAKMEACEDFVILWDNAYGVHHLSADPTEQAKLPNILALCEQYGHKDRAFVFVSTSKITYAGAGVAGLASSKENLEWYLSHDQYQTIGPDKLNQLQTVQLIEAAGGLAQLMAEHAEILKPKFDLVVSYLERELKDWDLATWHVPQGGYFVSVHLKPGLAKRVVALCQAAGVTLTGAGAAFPYQKDPLDSNIRIAPSYPPVSELEKAIQIFCVCVKMAALEQAE